MLFEIDNDVSLVDEISWLCWVQQVRSQHHVQLNLVAGRSNDSHYTSLARKVRLIERGRTPRGRLGILRSASQKSFICKVFWSVLKMHTLKVCSLLKSAIEHMHCFEFVRWLLIIANVILLAHECKREWTYHRSLSRGVQKLYVNDFIKILVSFKSKFFDIARTLIIFST